MNTDHSPRGVIVTGGARGIGAAIAGRFVNNGDNVVVLDIEAQACPPEGAGTCTAIACDLSDPVSTQSAMAEALTQLGQVDVLVNNAGIFNITPLLEITAAQWDRMFAVNTRAMLLTIQATAQSMIDRGTGGRIINMASMGGKSGAAGQSHYAASKAAVISLTQVAAAELGAHGINVNAMCPGYVLTDMGAATRTEEQVEEWSSLSPLGRLGEEADVANLAFFLASDESSYLTGQAINVCGGMITH